MKMQTCAALALCAACSSAAVFAGQTEAPNAGRDLSAACFTCHGTNGNSVGGVPPGLAGRDRGELLRSLLDFKSGKRPATIMHQQARGYTDEQLQIIAAYFAAIKPAPAAVPPKR
jgi:sulfide dehydrogenase cytochrome subunit